MGRPTLRDSGEEKPSQASEDQANSQPRHSIRIQNNQSAEAAAHRSGTTTTASDRLRPDSTTATGGADHDPRIDQDPKNWLRILTKYSCDVRMDKC
jgi:hypothetical protein